MITLAYAGFLRFNELSNLRCNDITFNSDHVVSYQSVLKSICSNRHLGPNVFVPLSKRINI